MLLEVLTVVEKIDATEITGRVVNSWNAVRFRFSISVGFVFQTPEYQLVMPIGADVAFGLVEGKSIVQPSTSAGV